ncbi:hypothetical protein FOBRF1_008027 [Fusarium oxysporum]
MTSNRFRLISTPLSLALAFHFMDTVRTTWPRSSLLLLCDAWGIHEVLLSAVSKELLRVKNILDPDEVGISTSRWAPGNSPPSSSKPAEPAVEVKDNESGEDSRRKIDAFLPRKTSTQVMCFLPAGYLAESRTSWTPRNQQI